MKKLKGKFLIGLICLGLLSSCGSGEAEIIQQAKIEESIVDMVEENEIIERSKADVQENEESETIVEELPVIEAESEAEAETEPEEVISNLVEETPVEEIQEEAVVEKQASTFTYAKMNKTMYASKAVNVRNQPNKDGEKVGGLALAQVVAVTGKCNESGWYRIDYNGTEAYVSNDYLIDEKPVQPQRSSNSNNSGGSSGSGNSVTVPTHEENVGNLVWVPTKGGTKYHSKSSCSGMEGPMQVSVETAQRNGFTACKRCH